MPSWGRLGAQFGGLQVFPIIKLIVVCQVRKLIVCTVGWVWKQSHAKSCAAHFFCVCFCVCVRQKHEDPQIEPHGWRRHYIGRYRESGISPLYLWPSLVRVTEILLLSFHYRGSVIKWIGMLGNSLNVTPLLCTIEIQSTTAGVVTSFGSVSILTEIFSRSSVKKFVRRIQNNTYGYVE